MKKKILLFTLASGMAVVTLMSNGSGAAGSGNSRTGADGSVANCGGSGCHGGAGATTATLRIDSVGGVQVTKYVPGMTYTVTVTGSHATNTKFGFQMAAVSGTGSSQVQAGTFATTLPASVAKRNITGIPFDFIEHSSIITGPLSKSFSWTAPATGVGTISMYLTVNAMNNTGGADAGDVSGNTSKTLAQHVASSSVADLSDNISLSAYPNPVTNTLNIKAGNGYGNYTVTVFDMTGRNIAHSTLEANVTGIATINTSDWTSGLYNVVVANENSRETIQIVKQ